MRVGAAALLVATGAVVMAGAGVGNVEQYPRLEVPFGPSEAALCATILLGAVLPFLGRSSRLGVARV